MTHAPLPSDRPLGWYDFVVINTSAGKDSQTMMRQLVAWATELGIKDRLVAVHADLGRADWPGTLELAAKQAAHYDLPFQVVSRDGDLLDHVLNRGMWPGWTSRFCTSDHKRGPVRKLHTALADQFHQDVHGKAPRQKVPRPCRILDCQGLRIEESDTRKVKIEAAIKKSRAPWEHLKAASSGRKHLDVSWPIAKWLETQVWEDIRQSGVPYHWAYDRGMQRLSCVFCPFADDNDLLIAGELNRELLDQYCEIEATIGHDFRGENDPISKIRDMLDAGTRGDPHRGSPCRDCDSCRQCQDATIGADEEDPLLVVNYGAGVDSTALLVEMHHRGIVPDLIIFADTGDEKPETYVYKEYFSKWLVAHGFPAVTTVTRYGMGPMGRQLVQKKETTTYDTLRGACEQNETMASLAFSFSNHSCSLNWKAAAIHGFLKQWQPFLVAQVTNRPVRHVIGYDNSTSDQKRRQKADAKAYSCLEHNCLRWYPLQDWRWDRGDCVARIAAAGLEVPVKSACYHCASSQKWEIAWLAASTPAQFLQALEIEDRWLAGKHGPVARAAKGKATPTRGLGFKFNWREWAQEVGILIDRRVDVDRARQIADETMDRKTAGTYQLTVLGSERKCA